MQELASQPTLSQGTISLAAKVNVNRLTTDVKLGREIRLGVTTMPRSDHRTLINMGRKAGLKTSELYSALVSHRAAPQEISSGTRDGNGFGPGFDAAGHQVYSPVGPTRAG